MYTRDVFLVIKPNGDMRLTKRMRLSADEVAVRLRLEFPKSCGKEIGTVTVRLPEAIPTVTPEKVGE